ncbi:suppressor of fused domain protein [Planctomycetes bacterium K23_9]|uniref:Suppressor of fused protein (SUFU) n=1 Tax=Stieleria marina TaxID=1930275 RepID=A0A517NNS2_9BACT|nr:Suppressor of fused protein (SUFU) [Planctomycetes bacterium K23_9]
MPRQWYIKSTSGSRGPFTSKTLYRLARDGKLTPNTGISSDGQHWFKAKKVPELNFDIATRSERDESTDSKRSSSKRPRNNRWFIQTKNGVLGPVSVNRLNRMARDGRIQPCVAVSKDKVRWIKAKRVRGVNFPPPTAVVQLPVRLPVLQELPIAGQLPRLSDLQPRRCDVISIELPVVADVPWAGPLPTLSDLPLRRNEVTKVVLTVIQELPVAGQLPSLGDLPWRRCDVVSRRLPVLAELPIAGPLPRLSDLPPRRSEVTAVALPIIHDLPIAGAVPTFQQIESLRVPEVESPDPGFAQMRRAALVQHLGELWQVAGANQPAGNMVDVCIHPGSAERPFTTLITNGMSDIPMDVPDGGWSPRAELIMYAREANPAYIRLLQGLAQIPRQEQRGFWYGATMANGDPAKAIFANSALDSFVFMIPAVASDFQISQSLSISDQPLQLLWVLPISSAERDLIDTDGMKRFCELLHQNHHQPLMVPHRTCYVSPSNAISDHAG